MPPKAPATVEEAQAIFQRYRTELQLLATKIGEIETDLDEHALVLKTLQPLQSSDPTRTCYRLIGGTLVKRTVTDVVPSLEATHNGIQKALDTLAANYKQKDAEFADWRKVAGVQMGSQ
ncbi:hypothetical protein B9479_001752 [Cryptococcus floricola]|uniref:Prefoldin subunit 2 n=1 Tax=Cryptococcus floricola TaxID=2591691 RepID=A0A5D3B564_9TREE|nr:hypothetical protein B9479_001752 [Cryptococcus floricola]